MSTLVVTKLNAKPGQGDAVTKLLLDILGDSLQHAGCETIRITRDQDDPDRVAAFTQWTERRNYEEYLAWRTDQGFTDSFEIMLLGPLEISYYDEIFFGIGIAATPIQ